MPKYLFQAQYTEKGLQAILNEGGTKRFEVMGRAVMQLGGMIEAFYYALGETDLFLIVNLPDVVSASALSILTNASDTVKVKTTVLLSPEEIDRAMKQANRS
jgi:uncharacterized protein with GYD domain